MESSIGSKAERFKAVVVTAAVLCAIAAIGFVALKVNHGRQLKLCREEAAAQVAATQAVAKTIAVELAEDLARTLGIAISDDVARVERAMLDSQLGAMVRGHRVAGIMVLSPSGEVVATTDQRWAGRTLDDAAATSALAVAEVSVRGEGQTPGQVEVAAPLFVGSQRVGAVRVFFDLAPVAP